MAEKAVLPSALDDIQRLLNPLACRDWLLGQLHPVGPVCPSCNLAVDEPRAARRFFALRAVRCEGCGARFTALRERFSAVHRCPRRTSRPCFYCSNLGSVTRRSRKPSTSIEAPSPGGVASSTTMGPRYDTLHGRTWNLDGLVLHALADRPRDNPASRATVQSSANHSDFHFSTRFFPFHKASHQGVYDPCEKGRRKDPRYPDGLNSRSCLLPGWRGQGAARGTEALAALS